MGTITMLIALLLLLILGFRDDKTQNNRGEFKIPRIINDSSQTALCLSPEYMLNAWYRKERLDSITDIIDLSNKGKNMRAFYQDPFFFSGRKKRKYTTKGIQIIVDTLNELTMTKKPIWARYLFHRYLTLSDSVEVLQDDTLIQMVKSFPIYIANLSSVDTAKIEVQDGSFMMTVEAIDPKGKWKPIEYWSRSWCGNSYYSALIPPKHMYMTRGVKCSGDFYTKCRMKVFNQRDSLFSNEFHMAINETQFEKPIQKDRDR